MAGYALMLIVLFATSVAIFGDQINLAYDPMKIDCAKDIHEIGLLTRMTRGGGAFLVCHAGETIRGMTYNDRLGRKTSISADGHTLAVAADRNGTGQVRVFVRDFQSGAWSQLGNAISGDEDNFVGLALSLSGDGRMIAISSRVTGAPTLGRVQVFALDATTQSWSKAGEDLDGPVNSNESPVSLSHNGERVAIGQPLYDSVNVGGWAGRVQVYALKSGAWSQLGEDIEGEAGSDQFGYSVSLSADGNRVAIGSIMNSGQAGHVRVLDFDQAGGAWSQVGGDIDGKASGERSGSLSLSADGTTVAIGAYLSNNNNGTVRVYAFNSTPGATLEWEQVGADINRGTARAESGSGFSVSLSADGKTVAVGSPQDERQKGSVQVYRYDLPQTEGGLVFAPGWHSRFDRIGNVENGLYGNSVSLSADGTTVASGIEGASGPALYAGQVQVFEIATAPIEWLAHNHLKLKTKVADMETTIAGLNAGQNLAIADLEASILALQNSQKDPSGLSTSPATLLAGGSAVLACAGLVISLVALRGRSSSTEQSSTENLAIPPNSKV